MTGRWSGSTRTELVRMIEVGPSQIIEFMSLFWKEVGDFGLRVRI